MGNQVLCCCHQNRTSPTPLETRVIRVLIVGLDNAGKTTAAKGLVGESVSSPAPTLGFSRLEARRRGWRLELYDVGGGRTIRGIWPNYLAECHALVYVVDASAPERAQECRSTLHALLRDHRVAGKPVLLLANKQDVPAALDEVELDECLQLEAVANQHRCPMRIELCSAKLCGLPTKQRHPAVHAGFNWLADYVIDNFTALSARVTADVAERAAELERQVRARQERVRRSREAAAAVAAAAAAEQASEQTIIRSSPAPQDVVNGGISARSAERVQSPDVAAASPTTGPQQQASPAPPDAVSAAASPEEEPATLADSPDTPLNPELEAQIQEVFTRTEMGRLVRDGERTHADLDRDGDRVREGAALGESLSAGQQLKNLTPGVARDTLDSVTPDQGVVSSERRGDRSGQRNGLEVAASDDGAGDEADRFTRRPAEPVYANGAPPSAQMSEWSEPEQDSGQGSAKESVCERRGSSCSQLSNGVLDSLEGGPKKRNRFFKRYTKTAPMPEDVLLTSVPSTPPPHH